MRVLAAENISKSYGERALLSDVTLQINQGDKIGLIGVNGTGKSTLLRLLAGEEAPDGGSIFCQPGHRAAYLPQNPVFAPEDTVLEHVLRGAGRDVQEESYRAKAILTKLGVTDFGETVGHLSGGQRLRGLAALDGRTADIGNQNRTKDGPVGGAGGDGPAHAVVGRQRWTSRRI